MIDLFFESMLTVIIGISGFCLIAVLMVLVLLVVLAIYTGIEFLLYKLGLAKEPGWRERARELKKIKASIPSG